MDSSNLLTILLATPIIGALLIGLLPEKSARPTALLTGLVMLGISLFGATKFDWTNNAALQMLCTKEWVQSPFPLNYSVGVDGMSMSLVLLTTVVTMLALVASLWITQREKLYYALVMLLTASILGVFTAQDLLQFFIAFEFELVPMYFLIAIWGGKNRAYAAMKFLLYTFTGGVLMLGGLLFLYFSLYAQGGPGHATLSMSQLALNAPNLPKATQGLAFLGFFLAFIIKLPSFPFHTWLPDAHVEAPTPISMILAGLLLKMGSYGLVRICMGFFPNVFIDHGNWIMYLGAWNIVWAAVACLAQLDMKRIIAFSSVSHMGFVLLGIGSLSQAGVNGAIFQMISHGIISAALFFYVGTIYERCHTRVLPEIGGGLGKAMPGLFYLWMAAALANLGLPGMSGFVAESAVFYGAYSSPMAQTMQHSAGVQCAIVFACTGVVLTAGYMLWLLKRLFYGVEQAKWKGHLSDCFMWERSLGYVMTAMIIAMGVYPSFVTNSYNEVVNRLVTAINTRTISAAPTTDSQL